MLKIHGADDLKHRIFNVQANIFIFSIQADVEIVIQIKIKYLPVIVIEVSLAANNILLVIGFSKVNSPLALSNLLHI